jgi:hypothetical protein
MPRPKKKKPQDMTTEEAMRHLFHKRVHKHVRDGIPDKKSDPKLPSDQEKRVPHDTD